MSAAKVQVALPRQLDCKLALPNSVLARHHPLSLTTDFPLPVYYRCGYSAYLELDLLLLLCCPLPSGRLGTRPDGPSALLLSLYIMASHLIRLYNRLDDYSNNPANPRSAVMVKLSRAVLAALKSLSRSTLALRRLFKSWLVRIVRDSEPPVSSVAPTLLGQQSSKQFAQEVDDALGVILDPAALIRFSEGLQQRYKDALVADPNCMLPSYNHQLPHGHESGTFLALDVGGSTFRVALVELRAPEEDGSGMKILSLKAHKIDNPVKQLHGLAFFDWMALKIEETLEGQAVDEDSVLDTGLSWSFPIEQVGPPGGAEILEDISLTYLIIGKHRNGVASYRAWERAFLRHTVSLVKILETSSSLRARKG